jgi:ankyrin repeat protein
MSNLTETLYEYCKEGQINEIQNLLSSNESLKNKLDVAFTLACLNEHTEIVKYLLEIKPDIDIEAKDDEAFKWAYENFHFDILKLIVKHKFNIDTDKYKYF